MYAYVMRPETLPGSYWRFIVASGPISYEALEATRRVNRGLPVDVAAVNDYCVRMGGAPALTSPHPPQIPNAVLHPWCGAAPWDLAFMGFFGLRCRVFNCRSWWAPDFRGQAQCCSWFGGELAQ
jgi:hypothetical protein